MKQCLVELHCGCTTTRVLLRMCGVTCRALFVRLENGSLALVQTSHEQTELDAIGPATYESCGSTPPEVRNYTHTLKVYRVS
jgi:hypothetical protein